MNDPVQVLRDQITGTREQAAPQQQANATQNVTTTSQEGSQDVDTDAWYDNLSDDIKAPVEAYTKSQTEKLQKALEAERKQKREIEKQVKELSVKAGGDEALKLQIEKIKEELTESNRKATFFESAASVKELAPSRYTAAYKIAKIDGMIDSDGEVDWQRLKAEHDYLFTSAQQEQVKRNPGNAGNGAGTGKPQSKQTMNDIIRRKASSG